MMLQSTAHRERTVAGRRPQRFALASARGPQAPRSDDGDVRTSEILLESSRTRGGTE